MPHWVQLTEIKEFGQRTFGSAHESVKADLVDCTSTPVRQFVSVYHCPTCHLPVPAVCPAAGVRTKSVRPATEWTQTHHVTAETPINLRTPGPDFVAEVRASLILIQLKRLWK